MKPGLTPKQLHVLDFVTSYTVQHGYAPTMAEIAAEMGTSRTSAHEHVHKLIRKGRLTYELHKSRSLSVVPVDGGLREAAVKVAAHLCGKGLGSWADEILSLCDVGGGD